MAGDSVIYRLDTVGENEGNAPEKIEFNQGIVPDNTGRNVTSNWHGVRDISIHPNPNKAQSIIQDGKLGTMEVVISGYFVKPPSTLGKGLFFDWMREDADNDSLPFGRFGVRINDLAEVDMNPDANKGYILYDCYCERVQDSPNEVMFIAKLYRNGTDV